MVVLRRGAEVATPLVAAADAKELIAYATHGHQGGKILKCNEAIDKLFATSRDIQAGKINIEAELRRQTISLEDAAFRMEDCEVMAKYAKRHFLKDVSHNKMAVKDATEILIDAKMLGTIESLEICGQNTWLLYRRTYVLFLKFIRILIISFYKKRLDIFFFKFSKKSVKQLFYFSS